MFTTNLRNVGGSVMLLVPPDFLEQLHRQAGAMVGMAIDKGCLMVTPRPRIRYTMAELLAQSDYSDVQPQIEREWVDAPPVGGELI